MDIEKQDSLNNFDAIDVPPAQNQVGQQMPSAVQLSHNPTINSIQAPQEQYLQVVQKQQTVFGNQAEFQKILSQLTKKNKKQSQYQTHIKKKPSQKKEDSSKLIKTEDTKKQKILKAIEPHVKNYKSLNNPNSSDSEVTKLRAQIKQKAFKFLMYGIQQLKMLKDDQLSPQQIRITKLTSKDPYILAKTLTTEIDIQFLKNINADNKQVASKKYKNFIKNFADNIGEQTNLQLRRKILTRQLTAKKMAGMQQQQFYPAHIRQKIIERQNILLRQAAVQQKPSLSADPQIEVQYQSRTVQIKEQKKQEQKPKYKYLQQSSIVMINDLLKREHIIKMRKILQMDLRKDIQEKLVGNITKVFESLL